MMMRSMDDKPCLNPTPELPTNFEFHKTNNAATLTRTPSHHHHRTTALGKPTPSKWDDAQKWLVNLSRGGGEKHAAKASPRNSNADDRRLIAHVAPKEDDEHGCSGYPVVEVDQLDTETKDVVDCVVEEDSIWRVNKHVTSSTTTKSAAAAAVRSICVRDTGTDMTPLASQEPSRTATPIRATTPAARSPISSGTSTPVRCPENGHQSVVVATQFGKNEEWTTTTTTNNNNNNNSGKMNPLESRAMAWDEAERAKYMARYKREEVKIQAWENHQKRKAEMEMRKMEVKAERMKSRAQEKYSNSVAAARRIAEEKRANAEGKLNEKGVKTSERADYIRRTGHLPHSFFSIKLPTFCW